MHSRRRPPWASPLDHSRIRSLEGASWTNLNLRASCPADSNEIVFRGTPPLAPSNRVMRALRFEEIGLTWSEISSCFKRGSQKGECVGERASSYQREGIEWLQSRRFGILADDPGLGKTMQAIMALEPPALVLCPASVKIHWAEEARRWRPEVADGIEVMSYSDRDLFLTQPRGLRTLILDEAQYVKSVYSGSSRPVQRTTHALRIARGVFDRGGSVHALSGTMPPNRPIELWPLLWACRATDMDFFDFAQRFCASYVDEWGQLNVDGASNLSELALLLEPHVLRRRKREVLRELPPLSWSLLSLDLPVGKREREMKVEELERLREPIARQAMSSILAEHGRRKLPLALQHCRDSLEGGSEKLAAFAWHRDVIEGLRMGLADYEPARVWGGMTAAEKAAEVRRFIEDPRCGVFVGQHHAAGVGTDGLQRACSKVVLVEGSWVPADLEQVVGRVDRRGQRFATTAEVLTISGSIDEHMLRRALEKDHQVAQIRGDAGPSIGGVDWRTEAATLLE